MPDGDGFSDICEPLTESEADAIADQLDRARRCAEAEAERDAALVKRDEWQDMAARCERQRGPAPIETDTWGRVYTTLRPLDPDTLELRKAVAHLHLARVRAKGTASGRLWSEVFAAEAAVVAAAKRFVDTDTR